MAKSKTKPSKIFVLDTSVILHDNNSFNSFEENDVAIPISVLEELDNFKKGNDTKNFEAREFARKLDLLSDGSTISEWSSLGNGRGNLVVVMNEKSTPDACEIFGENKADHRILNVAIRLTAEFPNKTVSLVTKDINLRIKAKSLGMNAEDYLKGRVKDTATTYKGRSEQTDVKSETIDKLYDNGSIPWADVFKTKPQANHYFILKNGGSSALSYFNPVTEEIERVEKRTAYGIKPKNAEQVFAMHAILNPNVKLVTISGVAGTGKTLLALSGAIESKSQFKQIYIARPIVPLSNKDIGFLPGDVKSKLNPYMEPLWDNLKFIKNQFKETDRDFKKITDMVDQEKLMISPLAYIRGRSLSNIFFIVDEAQNLTPHEIKTIITRAGENTKIIFTGDVNQIDSPYLDKLSNGLSYLIDKIQDHAIHAHITLEKGERSELANIANDLL
jgi:PhoH-like ATPase